MRTEGSIEIQSPIETVFHVTTELVSEWSTIVVEDELLAEASEGRPARIRTVTENGGMRMEFEGEVLVNNPPNNHLVHLRGDKFDLGVEHRFESLSPNSTRVTQISLVEPHGLNKWLFTLLGWAMKSASNKALQMEFASLKNFCENLDR